MVRNPKKLLLVLLCLYLSPSSNADNGGKNTSNTKEASDLNAAPMNHTSTETASYHEFEEQFEQEVGLPEEDGDDIVSDGRAKTVAYLPKPFSLFSILCSYVLIREVVEDQRSRKGGPIPRMLLSMAVADIIFSFGYFLGTWPAPPEYQHEATASSVGSQGFCTFQGFCIQLGYVASILATMVLSIYFLLVVRYGWTDFALSKVEAWAQGTIWLIAAVLAIYPIPMELYNAENEACHINSIPVDCSGDDCIRGSDTTVHQLVLVLLPLLGTLLYTSVIISIYVRVRHIENEISKYATSNNFPTPTSLSISHGTNGASTESLNQQQHRRSRIDRRKSIAVGKQGIYYALAFLLTYAPAIVIFIVFYATETEFIVAEDITFSVLIPSAGAFNFVIFAMPRTQMRTPEGRVLRACLFCLCCWKGDSHNTSSKGVSEQGGSRSRGQSKTIAEPVQEEVKLEIEEDIRLHVGDDDGPEVASWEKHSR